MTTRRNLRLAACLIGLLASLGAGPVAASAAADEAAAMYDPTTVDVVELTLPQTSIDALEAEPDEYQPGTFSFAYTDGTPNGIGSFSSPLPVKVRLKGKASFQPLTGKAAFKLKFGKTERFLGLKKMTLNNMFEDPSMLHERLTYEAFRAAGVPASRTGYVYLRVNGEDFGLYMNVETLDDVALARLFGSFNDETQHLYEGEDGHDVKPSEASEFEVDEGDEADLADLEALIEAVNSNDPEPFSQRVAASADLKEMTTMWAVEKYVAHWDGYSGKAGAHQPNNYYLLSDPSARFQMLPWGADETWSYDHPVSFDGAGGVMFNDCLADPVCMAAYRQSLEEVRAAIEAIHPVQLVDDTASLLAPWQHLERQESVRQPHGEDRIVEEVADTREFAERRGSEAAEWLWGPAVAELPLSSPVVKPPAPAEPPHAGPPIRLLSERLVRGAVVARLRIAEQGTVSQIGWTARQGRRQTLCRAPRRTVQPSTISIRCRLTPAGMAADAPLHVVLQTRFSTATHTEVLKRRLTLARHPQHQRSN